MKGSKYGNKRTTIGKKTFDSKKEAVRWLQLVAMQNAGKISFLQTQKSYTLEVNGVLICRYRADFVYIENEKTIVEDCKGFKTDVYKLKKKLMLAIYGIEIRES